MQCVDDKRWIRITIIRLDGEKNGPSELMGGVGKSVIFVSSITTNCLMLSIRQIQMFVNGCYLVLLLLMHKFDSKR